VTIAPEVEDLDKVRQHFGLVQRHCSGTPGAQFWPWSTHSATQRSRSRNAGTLPISKAPAPSVRIVFENYFVSERRANAVGSQSGWVDCRPHQNRR
jgi:hypothetical protein